MNLPIRITAAAILLSATSSRAELSPVSAPRQRVSLGYNSATGQVWLDVEGCNLTSINIDSNSGIFANHDVIENLDGSFDQHSETHLFKATFGGDFDSLSFGNIAPPGLTEEFLLADVSLVGSGKGGCDPLFGGLIYTNVSPLVLGGSEDDDTTSIIYDANSGELSVDVPRGAGLRWVGLFSSAHVFTEESPWIDLRAHGVATDRTLLSARPTQESFSFGLAAKVGLGREFLLEDIFVVGAPMRQVDLIYVPEPSTVHLVLLGFACWLLGAKRLSAGKSDWNRRPLPGSQLPTIRWFPVSQRSVVDWCSESQGASSIERFKVI